MSKNPPDWWVRISRILGVLGFLIALGSLALGYFSYRWQREVYAKSQEERILVQLSSNLLSLPSSPNIEGPQTQLAIEVVNLGQQPMYLKSVTGEVMGRRASFYEYYPQAKEAMRKLEPGEAADYTIDWQWTVEDAEKEGGISGVMEVETTKKRFTQFTHLSSRVMLIQIVPRKKLRPPRPQ